MPTPKRERKREGRAARQAAIEAARRRAQRRRQTVVAVVVIAGVILLAALVTRGGGKSKKSKVASTDTTAVSTSTTTASGAAAGSSTTAAKAAPAGCPKPDGSSPRTTKFSKAPPTCIDPSKTYVADITTDAGTIEATLDAKRAPKTVNNFVFLARYHFFDGLTFHRVVPNFVLQGGDPAGNGSGGPGYEFADELPKAGEYKVGSLAMANSGPNTNGSQFFVISGQEGVQLPPQYSLFGQTTSGFDVIKKIEADGAPDPSPPRVVHKMVHVTIKET